MGVRLGESRVDYKFGRVRTSCAICEQPFQTGDLIRSVLREVVPQSDDWSGGESGSDAGPAAIDGAEDAPETAATASTAATAPTAATTNESPATEDASTPEPAEASEGSADAPATFTDGLSAEPEYERIDVCPRCWPTYGPPSDVYSWWARERLDERPKAPIQDPEFLWMLLGATRAEADPERDEPTDRDLISVHLAYLAALGLLRLKQFELKRHFRQDNVPFLVFHAKSTSREYAVLDPEPSDEGLEAVERLLEEVAARMRDREESLQEALAAAGEARSEETRAAIESAAPKKRRRKRIRRTRLG